MDFIFFVFINDFLLSCFFDICFKKKYFSGKWLKGF